MNDHASSSVTPLSVGAIAANSPAAELDPCLELFGHGWTPSPAVAAVDETYVGRHRAS